VITPIGRSFKIPMVRGRLLWLPEDNGEAVRSGSMFFNGHLFARRFNVERIDSWDLGSGLVTDAGVASLVDYLDAGTPAQTPNFHDSGTGANAAAVGDTALQTEAGPTTRATGTKSQPTAPEYRSIGTITYTGTLAITEWGLFYDATRGADTMWDRRVFTAINVVNTDSIEFTYTLTVNSGG
jgi:hypothetical protein